MTIAIQSKPTRSSTFHLPIPLFYRLFAPFQRLWWHTQAYTVIFGVMALTGLSVIVLYLHDHLSRTLARLLHHLSSSNRTKDISTAIKQRG